MAKYIRQMDKSFEVKKVKKIRLLDQLILPLRVSQIKHTSHNDYDVEDSGFFHASRRFRSVRFLQFSFIQIRSQSFRFIHSLIERAIKQSERSLR